MMLIFMFFLLCYFTSPLLCFYLAIIFFSFVSLNSLPIRFAFSIIIIISGATIFSSRVVGISLGDDFYYVYMPVYQAIKNGASVFNGYYSSGAEFVLPVLFKIFSVVDNTFFVNGMTYSSLMFCFIVTFSLLFYFWMEIFILPRIEVNKTLCLMSAFIFLNFFMLGYMMRQAFSTLFILYSLGFFSQKKLKSAYMMALVASCTHLSAIPILFIFYIYMFRGRIAKITLISTISFFSLSFAFIKTYILSSGLLGVATYKLDYYNQDIGDLGHGYIVHMLFLMTFSYLFISEKWKEFRSLIFFGGLTYFILFPIPLASDRILMPLTSFMLGFLIFISLGRYSRFLRYALIPYCILRFLKYGPLYNGYGVDSYYLWHFYPWFGSFIS